MCRLLSQVGHSWLLYSLARPCYQFDKNGLGTISCIEMPTPFSTPWPHSILWQVVAASDCLPHRSICRDVILEFLDFLRRIGLKWPLHYCSYCLHGCRDHYLLCVQMRMNTCTTTLPNWNTYHYLILNGNIYDYSMYIDIEIQKWCNFSGILSPSLCLHSKVLDLVFGLSLLHVGDASWHAQSWHS